MKKNWILIAWDNPLEIRAIHIVDGAKLDDVKSYACRLWSFFGANLYRIDVHQVGTDKRFYIGG